MTKDRPPDPRWVRTPRPVRRLPARGDSTRRLGVTLLAIVFVLSLFAGRLVQLQGMESGSYRKLALHERDKTIPLPAMRGSITGANGQVLAMTVATVPGDGSTRRRSRRPSCRMPPARWPVRSA